jgi:Xaa-Pro aminopeptidase
MGRSGVLGRPDEKTLKYWNAIFEGEKLAIDMAEPGVKASVIFNSAVEEVRNSGIPDYRRHHTGHGWGIEHYDPPLIGPNDHTSLEKGMVLCFETPYYEVGWGGLLHEDIVVITGSKPRYLTKFEGELRMIEE